MKYSEAFAQLNEQQKKAVTTIDGPVFVLAGPGTGKTQMLTLRIAHIIETMGADAADSVLALTFTNAAVRSMKDRLTSFTDHETASRVGIFTFHSFAQSIIQEYPESFGSKGSFTLIGDLERYTVMQDILTNDIEFGSIKPLYDEYLYLREVIARIGDIKREGYTYDQYLKSIDNFYKDSMEDESMFYRSNTRFGKKGEIKQKEVVKLEKKVEKQRALAEVFRIYQEKLEEQEYFDYADLLYVLRETLREDAELRAELQERYQYILVDEHQDTNSAQLEIIELLINNPVWERKPNIFTVGDLKQAIFSFAGSSGASFKQLKALVENPLEITLETNYRSGQHILDESYDLINDSEEHQEEVLDSFFKHDGSIQVRSFSDYKYETVWIVEKIQELIASSVDPSEIAILFRKNAEAEVLRRALRSSGIPLRDFTKRNLLQEPEMLLFMMLSKVIENLDDNVALSRLLYAEFIAIHPYSVSKILKKVRENRKSVRKNIFAVLLDEKTLKELDIPKDEIRVIQELTEVLSEAHALSVNKDLISIFTFMTEQTGYLQHLLGSDNSAQSLAAFEAIFDLIVKQGTARPFSISDFNEHVTLMKERGISIDIPPTSGNGVTITTFHGSKGLEFEHVFIYNTLSTGTRRNLITLPFTEKTPIDEERRLFFVALTRAKNNLYITYPQRRADGREMRPLAFIVDRKVEYVDTSEYEQTSDSPLLKLLGTESEKHLSILSPEYIQERFLGRPLSVSALNNYVTSPVYYYFRNLLLLPEPQSKTLEFGNYVHKVLELYFKEAQENKKLPSKERILEISDEVSEQSRVWEILKSKASQTISDYYDARHESFTIPVEVEYPVFGPTIDVAGHTLRLTGRIDKIEKNEDGQTVVVDYKTGKSYSEQSGSNKEEKQLKREKIIRQAVFYSLILENYRGGIYRTRTSIFEYVSETEAGGYERHEVHVTDEMLQTLRTEIEEMGESIMSGRFVQEIKQSDDVDERYQDLFEILGNQ